MSLANELKKLAAGPSGGSEAAKGVAVANAGPGFFDPIRGTSTLPSADTLNFLTLLQKLDEAQFAPLIKRELQFFIVAKELLEDDVAIREKMGGMGVESTIRLAETIRRMTVEEAIKGKIREKLPPLMGGLGLIREPTGLRAALIRAPDAVGRSRELTLIAQANTTEARKVLGFQAR